MKELKLFGEKCFPPEFTKINLLLIFDICISMKSNVDLFHLSVFFQIFELGEHCLKYFPPPVSAPISYLDSPPSSLTAHTWLLECPSISGTSVTVFESSRLFYFMQVLHRASCWESISYSCFLTFSFFKLQTLLPSPCSQLMTFLVMSLVIKKQSEQDFLSFLPPHHICPSVFCLSSLPG